MNNNTLVLSVQRALLGAVPPTLRFIYAHIESQTLFFHAVFTDDAPEDHLECVNMALTEVIATLPPAIQLCELIERNSSAPWRMGNAEGLLFLRYGESETA